MAISAFLVVGPWVGSRIVKAQEDADSVAYAVGAARVMMLNCERAFRVSQENQDIALWALQQRRRGRHLR